ncbi:aldo/keto reductase [Methanocella sp. CWC-04]|uniref:Aldo/keto reductase n=1 Tax=Methanooceanicella nereidis TaxID=2052831 RepID=A0AAP2RBW8_9EURY|nr:aldo/keto reductase [Methanocella sp. CWC-04]MCD1294096.1 aldo/keto reductase [Methanocella sp. CWC-04]
MAIDTTLFGNTGVRVTRIGLGGEGVLRTYGMEKEAEAVIKEATEKGITYYDCAKAYAGSQGYYGNFWSKYRDVRAGIFQASKSASRDRSGALSDLSETLRTMSLEHLDLWQIHDVRTREDIKEIEEPGGALEAFIEAKGSGKVRFIGVTGHHDPEILTYAVENWPVDSVMMPVNPVEGSIGGFLDSTLIAARKKSIAVIGMKILGAQNYIFPDEGITPDVLIRYALSQDIDVAIVGCSNIGEVRTLVNCGTKIMPMTEEEREDLVDLFRPYAKKLAYYRGVL